MVSQMPRNLTCVDCTDSVVYSNLNELEAHIASDHLAILPYSCEKCQYAKFPTEFTLVEHHRRKHAQLVFVAQYRYTPQLQMKRKELAEKVLICFENSRKANEREQEIETSNQPELIVDYVNVNEPEQEVIPIFSMHSPLQVASPDMPRLTPFYKSPSEQKSEMIGVSRDSSYFDQSIPSKTAPMKKQDVVQCFLCSEVISNQRSSMMYHANTRHKKLVLYKCGYCMREWMTVAKSDIQKHMMKNHADSSGFYDETKLIDLREINKHELKKMTKKCFPREQTLLDLNTD